MESTQPKNVEGWPFLQQYQGLSEMFAIYERPLDYPSHFVVRRWFAGREITIPDVVPRIAENLEVARSLIPPGFERIPHRLEDDAFLIETWISASVAEILRSFN